MFAPWSLQVREHQEPWLLVHQEPWFLVHQELWLLVRIVHIVDIVHIMHIVHIVHNVAPNLSVDGLGVANGCAPDLSVVLPKNRNSRIYDY